MQKEKHITRYRHDSLKIWLEKLAEKSPTPGGGSAAAMAGAMGAALTGMVIQYSLKKATPWRRSQLRLMLRRVEVLRKRLLALVEEDARAYEGMRQAYKQKRGARKVQQAVRRAAEVPFATATSAWECLAMARDLLKIGNPNLLSDTVAAGLFSYSAVQGACGNVCINLPSLTSQPLVRSLRRRTKLLIKVSQATTIRLLRIGWKRLGA